MLHRRLGDRWVVRLETGEPVLETLTRFCEGQGIDAGAFSAIGAVRWARLGCYEEESGTYREKRFEGGLEVVSMTGNVSRKSDGTLFAHTHVVLSDGEMRPVAGHLFEAEISATLEVYLWPADGGLRRTPVPGSALELLDLEG